MPRDQLAHLCWLCPREPIEGLLGGDFLTANVPRVTEDACPGDEWMLLSGKGVLLFGSNLSPSERWNVLNGVQESVGDLVWHLCSFGNRAVLETQAVEAVQWKLGTFIEWVHLVQIQHQISSLPAPPPVLTHWGFWSVQSKRHTHCTLIWLSRVSEWSLLDIDVWLAGWEDMSAGLGAGGWTKCYLELLSRPMSLH